MHLGIRFKATKEDGLNKPTWQLEYFGIMLDTAGGEVWAYPTATKCNKLCSNWGAVLDQGWAFTEKLMMLLSKLAVAACTMH